MCRFLGGNTLVLDMVSGFCIVLSLTQLPGFRTYRWRHCPSLLGLDRMLVGSSTCICKYCGNGFHVCANFQAVNGKRSQFVDSSPTAGGQYHWVSEFAPPRFQKILSYITGRIGRLVLLYLAHHIQAGLLRSAGRSIWLVFAS